MLLSQYSFTYYCWRAFNASERSVIHRLVQKLLCCHALDSAAHPFRPQSAAPFILLPEKICKYILLKENTAFIKLAHPRHRLILHFLPQETLSRKIVAAITAAYPCVRTLVIWWSWPSPTHPTIQDLQVMSTRVCDQSSDQSSDQSCLYHRFLADKG
jgi:hypothetical protein